MHSYSLLNNWFFHGDANWITVVILELIHAQGGRLQGSPVFIGPKKRLAFT